MAEPEAPAGDAPAAGPAEEQPQPARELTPDEIMALAEAAAADLKVEQARYADAKANSMRDAQGRVLVAPFQLQLEIDQQRVRLDAVMLVLAQMGINIALPVTQTMPALYKRMTDEMGRVQVAKVLLNDRPNRKGN